MDSANDNLGSATAMLAAWVQAHGHMAFIFLCITWKYLVRGQLR